MTIRFRRTYNDFEITLLEKKLLPLIEDRIIEFAAGYDVDDIVTGNAVEITNMIYELLLLEMEHNLIMAQVIGIMPFEAFTMAQDNIRDMYNATIYDQTFTRLSKDK